MRSRLEQSVELVLADRGFRWLDIVYDMLDWKTAEASSDRVSVQVLAALKTGIW